MNILNKKKSHVGRKSSIVNKVMHQARMSRMSAKEGGLSYVRDLEFPADGPGRVIVRLERLMGSDRIRITDTKYMATLLQRLQEEEEVTWQKRTRERRKAEHQRFRQLVIDGYTEPTPGMLDLYNHPVFRVNRILQRLSRLNMSVTPVINLPPIIPVDPFKYDDSGRVFKSYPGHFPVAKTSDRLVKVSPSTWSSYSQGYSPVEIESQPVVTFDGRPHTEEEEKESGEKEENPQGEFFAKLSPPKRPSFVSHPHEESGLGVSHSHQSLEHHVSTLGIESGLGVSHSHQSLERRLSAVLGEDEEKGVGRMSMSHAIPMISATTVEKHLQTHSHIGFSRGSMEQIKDKKSKERPSAAENIARLQQEREEEEERHTHTEVLTLKEIQDIYGIAPGADLGVQWKPYQDPVVEKLFLKDEQKRILDLYKMGSEIVDMFDRQQQTTDDYIKSITRLPEPEEEEEEEEEVVPGDDGDGDIRSMAEIGEYVADLGEGWRRDDSDDDGLGAESDLGEEDRYSTKSKPLSSRMSDIEGPPTWDNNFEEELWDAPEE